MEMSRLFGRPLQVTFRRMVRDRCPVCPVSVTLAYCGQAVGWIKMPVHTEVGLGASDIVLDGDPAPHGKRHRPNSPHLSAHVCCGQRSPVARLKMVAVRHLVVLKIVFFKTVSTDQRVSEQHHAIVRGIRSNRSRWRFLFLKTAAVCHLGYLRNRNFGRV